MEIDFGDLKNDTNFVTKANSVKEAIENIDKAIKASAEINYEELTTEEKVKHDLFLAYSINSLFFMYLKVNGADPNSHNVKGELGRIKELFQKDKQILESKTLRPKLDQQAAKRFVKGGLFDHKQASDNFKKRHHQQNSKKFVHNKLPITQQNKKIKFDD